MKEILAVITFLVAAVLGEPPAAPYPASGWRPSGPAFELPQKNSQNPNQLNSYGVPLQNQYGVPDDTISVQGLPITEQRPLFVISPVNGQQYVGPNFNTDIRNLNENFKETQFQKQQETFRTISRERELNTRTRQQNNIGVPSLQTPRQFYQTSTYPSITESTKTTANTNDPTDNFRFTEPEQVTENPSYDENEKATDKKKTESPVEITKQNIQEIAPEIYLSPLTQLNSPLQQLGQLRAPVFFQPNAASIPQFNQKLITSNFGYDGPIHLAALQSILSSQNQVLAQPQIVQNQNSFEQMPSMVLVNRNEEQEYAPEQQFNQQQPLYPQQVQPVLIRNQGFISQDQYQQSREYLYPNLNVAQQNESNNEYNKNYTPQFVINPPQVYQPQEVQYQQPFYTNPEQNAMNEQGQQNQMVFANQYQMQYRPEVQYQPDNLNQYYQNQLLQQNQDTQNNFQNNQGNDLEQTEKENSDEDDSSVSAVATAFGTRTSPRVFKEYGVPKSDVDPRSATAEPTESSTDENPIAEATAVSRGGKRKSAKLRSRRVRPLFTLDRSGHLILVNNE